MSSAVLAKSQQGVERILQKSCETVNARNKLGQTGLHLAADWPWGLNRLLAAGADVDIGDIYGVYPLYYASRLDCLDTVKALIQADSPLVGKEQSYGTGPFGQSLWFQASDAIFDQFCTALVDRRSRLASFPKRVLSTADYTRILGSSSRILDARAGEITRALLKSGYQIPSALQVPTNSYTVYHTEGLTVKHTERLYAVGFRDVDTPLDTRMTTPFVQSVRYLRPKFLKNNPKFSKEKLSVSEWLMCKGEDPWRKVRPDKSAPIYLLCEMLAQDALATVKGCAPFLKSLNSQARNEFEDFIPGLEIICQDTVCDTRNVCRCGCTTQQCPTITIFLKCVIAFVHRVTRSHYRRCYECTDDVIITGYDQGFECCRQHRQEELYIFLKCFLKTSCVKQSTELTHDAILRLFIFEELEISQTCCIVGNRDAIFKLGVGLPDDEVQEICEEEKDLLQEPETWCKEASRRRPKSHDPDPSINFLRIFMKEV